MSDNQYEDLFFHALSQRFSAKDFWIHCERIAGALKQFYEDGTAYEIGDSHFYEILPEDTRRFMNDVYNLAADSIEFGPEKLAQHYWTGYGKQEPFFRHLRDTSIEDEYTGAFGQIMNGCGLDGETYCRVSENCAFLLKIADAAREQLSREALARDEMVCVFEDEYDNISDVRSVWTPQFFVECGKDMLDPDYAVNKSGWYQFVKVGSEEFRSFLNYEQPEKGAMIVLRLGGMEKSLFKVVQDFAHPDFLRENGDETAILLAYLPADVVAKMDSKFTFLDIENAIRGFNSTERQKELAFDIQAMIDEYRGVPQYCTREVMYRMTGIDVFEHHPELSPDQRSLSEIGMNSR
jgi:hypothetical protein